MLLYKNAFHYIIEKADVPIGIEFLQLVCLVLLDVKVLNIPSKTSDWKFDKREEEEKERGERERERERERENE